MNNKYDFATVLESARRGNAAETAEIAGDCIRRPWFIISLLTENRSDAETVMEKTFRTTFLNLDLITQQLGLRRWVETLAMRHCVEYLIEKDKDFYLNISAASSSPQMSASDIEEERYLSGSDKLSSLLPEHDAAMTLINGVIKNLDGDQKAALVLFYMQDLTVEQVAGDLKSKKKKVLSRLIPVRDAVYNSMSSLPKAMRIPAFIYLMKNLEQGVCVPPDAERKAIAAAQTAAKEYSLQDHSPKSKKLSFFDLFRKKDK